MKMTKMTIALQIALLVLASLILIWVGDWSENSQNGETLETQENITAANLTETPETANMSVTETANQSQGVSGSKYAGMTLPELGSLLLRPGISLEESQLLYNQLAALGKYDELHEYASYTRTAHDQVMAAVTELFPAHRKSVRVLDVGAGSGVLGQKLFDAGYKNMDAIDPSREMLKLAEAKEVYANRICSFFTEDPVKEIPNDSYDLLVMCGVLGPGAIPVEAFHEAVRILKPGGYIVNAMRAEYLHTCPEYNGRWEPVMAAMTSSGQIELVSEVTYPGHFFNFDGLRQVFRAL